MSIWQFYRNYSYYRNSARELKNNSRFIVTILPEISIRISYTNYFKDLPKIPLGIPQTKSFKNWSRDFFFKNFSWGSFKMLPRIPQEISEAYFSRTDSKDFLWNFSEDSQISSPTNFSNNLNNSWNNRCRNSLWNLFLKKCL